MTSESAPVPTPEQIEALLRQRLGRRIQDLQVLIQDGGLILRGVARNFYVKQLAQHLAMEAARLSIRANEIQVC
jgi:hypothetical protein